MYIGAVAEQLVRGYRAVEVTPHAAVAPILRAGPTAIRGRSGSAHPHGLAGVGNADGVGAIHSARGWSAGDWWRVVSLEDSGEITTAEAAPGEGLTTGAALDEEDAQQPEPQQPQPHSDNATSAAPVDENS